MEHPQPSGTGSSTELPIPTDDGQMSAGGNACDNVCGDTLPLSVVILAEGSELEAATRKGVVLASTGLPYLGQTREKEEGKEDKKEEENTKTKKERKKHNSEACRKDMGTRQQCTIGTIPPTAGKVSCASCKPPPKHLTEG